MIEVTGLVHLLVFILVVAVIFGLIAYIINAINPPEPYGKVARVALVVIGCLILIGILLRFIGYPLV